MRRRFGSPVVLITSVAARPVIARTVKLGACDYIAKPFTAAQVREVTARVLGVDPASFPQYAPKVLIHCRDEGAVQRLRALLPDHVQVVSSALARDTWERLGQARYALVLVDEELIGSAALIRAKQPDAAILGLSQFETEPLPVPDGALDGEVPRGLDERVVAFLFSVYLRPLAFVERREVRAAGFDGNANEQRAYFAQLRAHGGGEASRAGGEPPRPLDGSSERATRRAASRRPRTSRVRRCRAGGGLPQVRGADRAARGAGQPR